jgi:hypothetical protein
VLVHSPQSAPISSPDMRGRVCGPSALCA